MFKTVIRRAGKCAAVAAAGLMMMSAQAAEPIKIGSFLSVTGPASFLGDPELKTLEMYVEKINEEGGVLGRQLELIHYDDVGNASSARNFASRLIRSDRVDIIVGGSTTGATWRTFRWLSRRAYRLSPWPVLSLLPILSRSGSSRRPRPIAWRLSVSLQT